MIPRSLIQIHYHNRPGGVTQVIGYYAQAFKNIAGLQAVSLLMCHGGGENDLSRYDVINIPEFDYFQFKTKKDFIRCKGIVKEQIVKVLSSDNIERPVVILGHNLNLGKNCTIGSALSELAISFCQDKQIRFISVMHDFAEEGRTELLTEIEKIAKYESNIREKLYGVVSGITPVAIGSLGFSVLKKANFPVEYLANPVILENQSKVKKTLQKQIVQKLKETNPNINPKRPFFYYPSRLIRFSKKSYRVLASKLR